MPQLEHIEAIEKRLWGAADTLRPNSNYAGLPDHEHVGVVAGVPAGWRTNMS